MTAQPMKKILVVDDSSTALMMSMTVLSREPYILFSARDGQEAVHKARSERPDLILMDVIMPRMNGFEACQELRSFSETRHVPILLVTTRGEEKSVERGFEVGCTDYVTKPINGPELLAKVRTYLS
jgi:PleD family two-component response regulator